MPPMTPATRLFISYLEELPLDDWVRAAGRRPIVYDIAEAEESLYHALQNVGERDAVFAVQDAVLNVLQRFESPTGRRLSRIRNARGHLRPATEHAALAVLLRSHLTPETYRALYEPFEPFIPSAVIFGLPRS